MGNLLLNPATQQDLERFIAKPSHGLLLTGPRGSGKSTLLSYLAASLLGISLEQLERYPYVLRIAPDDHGTIGIDAVRQIDHFILLAVPQVKRQAVKRVITIDDCELLSIEAQNALLKNLEEPPRGTIFILGCANPNRLLLTLRSRLTLIRVVNPQRSQLEAYLKDLGTDSVSTARAIGISGGSVGLAIALVTESDSHPLAEAATTARRILSANLYDRLLIVNELHKNPELAKDTIRILQQMARIALETASGDQSKRWQAVLHAAYSTNEYLEHNSNLRLTLTYLILHL